MVRRICLCDMCVRKRCDMMHVCPWCKEMCDCNIVRLSTGHYAFHCPNCGAKDDGVSR